MSRSIVIIVRTISFCVLANVVCGSQYYYWSNGRTRNPRYASCPSCHRDCPDALSSPWYPRESYSEVSPSRNYRGFDGRSYGERASSSSLSTFYPRNEYGRLPRSGGANPTDVTASGTTNSHQYREPFDDRQLRRIDPYLASKPSTPSLSKGSVLNPYPFMPMTNSLISSNYEKQSYQPRKFSHELADGSANFRNNQEYNDDRSSKLNENPYRNKLFGPSYVAQEEDDAENYSKASQEKFLVVYRADGNIDEEEEEEKEENTSSFERSDSMNAFNSRTKNVDGPFANIDMNSFLQGYPTREKELVASREPFAKSNHIRKPEIKRNPYNLSPRLNFENMMQNVRDIDQNENPVQLWQHERESSNEEIDKSLESLTRDTDYYVSSIDSELVNESTKTIRNDVPNNEEEKLLTEQAIKITETKGDAIDEGSLKFDPDLVEDIENPPVDPTEPTPTSEPTETSMTEKHSR